MRHKADGWWKFSTSKATPENPKYLGANIKRKGRKNYGKEYAKKSVGK